MRSRLWIALLPALAAALGACRAERKPSEIREKLSAPTGLYVLGSGATPVLLVSNANFRLEYQSGSLLALDLSRVDESKRLNVVEDVARSAVELPNFSGPIALAPDGRTALVTNRFSEGEARSSDDRLFFVDVSNLDALALAQVHPGTSDTSGAITVGPDPYGVITLRLPPSGPGRPARDLAFVANETDATISVVNLTDGSVCSDGRAAPCIQDATQPPRATRPVFADVGTNSNIVFDGPGVSEFITRDQHWDVTFIEGNGNCPTPTDPAVHPGYWRIVGSEAGQLTSHACTDFFFVSSEITFRIARVLDSAGNAVGGSATAGDKFSFDTFAGDFESGSGIRLSRFVVGGSISGIGVGQLLYDPFRGRLYATSRRTNFVYVIDVDTYRFLGAWQISSNIGGIDSRGLVLSPDGSELYVVNRSPDALLVINPESFPRNVDTKLVIGGVVASIPLSAGSGELALSADGRFAFVASFNANAVDIIDVLSRTRVRSIPTSLAPYTIRLNSDATRAYVATYFGPAIDILDIDPLSATFGTVITTIADADYVPPHL